MTRPTNPQPRLQPRPGRPRFSWRDLVAVAIIVPLADWWFRAAVWGLVMLGWWPW